MPTPLAVFWTIQRILPRGKLLCVLLFVCLVCLYLLVWAMLPDIN